MTRTVNYTSLYFGVVSIGQCRPIYGEQFALAFLSISGDGIVYPACNLISRNLI